MASASLRAMPFILATDPNTKEGIILKKVSLLST